MTRSKSAAEWADEVTRAQETIESCVRDLAAIGAVAITGIATPAVPHRYVRGGYARALATGMVHAVAWRERARIGRERALVREAKAATARQRREDDAAELAAAKARTASWRVQRR